MTFTFTKKGEQLKESPVPVLQQPSQRLRPRAPSQNHMGTSQPPASEPRLCLGASGLCLHWLCVSFSKMGPRESERPERALEGVMLSVKQDIIKHIWYDLVGNFGGLGTFKNVSI